MSTPARHDADAAMSLAEALRQIASQMHNLPRSATADAVEKTAREALPVAEAQEEALRRAAVDLEAAATVVESAMGERANGIRQTLAMVRAALAAATPQTPPEDATND